MTTKNLGMDVWRARHSLNIQMRITFDLASIEVYDQWKDTFKKVLAICEELCPWDGIYVETVLSPQLDAFFVKRHPMDGRWQFIQHADHAPRPWFCLRDAEME